jgi:hypothetical protein
MGPEGVIPQITGQENNSKSNSKCAVYLRLFILEFCVF